jgi:hypothetical protein
MISVGRGTGAIVVLCERSSDGAPRTARRTTTVWTNSGDGMGEQGVCERGASSSREKVERSLGRKRGRESGIL